MLANLWLMEAKRKLRVYVLSLWGSSEAQKYDEWFLNFDMTWGILRQRNTVSVMFISDIRENYQKFEQRNTICLTYQLTR